MYQITLPDITVVDGTKMAEHDSIVAYQFIVNQASFKEIKLFMQFKKSCDEQEANGMKQLFNVLVSVNKKIQF